MATNARIDDLRRRLDKEPGSRLFAQLAEELRKAGELDEAISVARDGLAKHPAYASARMTLGRALFDLGDLQAARTELEIVVAAAPDNILACRLLGEALEGLSLYDDAAARYRTVLALAPGDHATAERLAALALLATETPSPAGVPPMAPAPVLEDDALETLHASTLPLALETPIPLVPLAEGEEEFELERPSDTTARLMAVAEPAARPFDPADWQERDDLEPAAPATLPPQPWAEPAGFGGGREELAFDFEAQPESVPDAPTIPFAPVEAAVPAQPAYNEPAYNEPASDDPASDEELEPEELPSSPHAVPALSSPTLAELYFSQGVPEKAAAVYRQILGREPWNARARARLLEIEAQLGVAAGRALAEVPEPEPVGPPQTRREALERTIARLEAFLQAVKEGRQSWPASPRH